MELTLPSLQVNRWVIGFSGGLDSTVLLHLMATQVGADKCVAVHINHQFQAESDAWAKQCEAVAQSLGVPFTLKTLDQQPRKGDSIEAFARTARYDLFADILKPGDCLLTAHHQDDQAETLLLNLCRGAGLKGLAAMLAIKPFSVGHHARPLLNISRHDLAEYAQQQGLSWIDDPSNTQTEFDRNFIRHEILPKLAERYPAVSKTMSRAAGHLADANALLDELAASELKLEPSDPFPLSVLLGKSQRQQQWLLRYWLSLNNMRLSQAQLEELIRQCDAKDDATVCVENTDGQIRRYQGKLYVVRDLVVLPEFELDWDGVSDIELENIHIPAARLYEQGLKPGEPYQLFSRKGSMRIRPKGRQHSTTVKKYLQEINIPPWQRESLVIAVSEQGIAHCISLSREEKLEEIEDFHFAMQVLEDAKVGNEKVWSQEDIEAGRDLEGP